MGRAPICTCGYVKFWHGVANSSENSQHITDWVMLPHVIHGMGFYALLWLVARRAKPGSRLPVGRGPRSGVGSLRTRRSSSTAIACAATIALDYYGDSVLNSVSDIAAMMSSSGWRGGSRCGSP